MDLIDFKVTKCLKCNSLTDKSDPEEFFCSKCGAPVINFCSSYDCNRPLQPQARFCKYCGTASTFKNYGLLEEIAPIFKDDDLPF